jgi:hypothetical protein
MKPTQPLDPATALRTDSGRLLTSVVTYFPPGCGVLLTRIDNEHLEIRLVSVDQAGGVQPIGVEPLKEQQGTANPAGSQHGEALAERDPHGFSGREGRYRFFKALDHGLKSISALLVLGFWKALPTCVLKCVVHRRNPSLRPVAVNP